MTSTPNDCPLLSNQNTAYDCVKIYHNIAIILILVCVGEREREREGEREVLRKSLFKSSTCYNLP